MSWLSFDLSSLSRLVASECQAMYVTLISPRLKTTTGISRIKNRTANAREPRSWFDRSGNTKKMDCHIQWPITSIGFLRELILGNINQNISARGRSLKCNKA